MKKKTRKQEIQKCFPRSERRTFLFAVHVICTVYTCYHNDLQAGSVAVQSLQLRKQVAALVHVAMEFSFKPAISIPNVLSIDFQSVSLKFLLKLIIFFYHIVVVVTCTCEITSSPTRCKYFSNLQRMIQEKKKQIFNIICCVLPLYILYVILFFFNL